MTEAKADSSALARQRRKVKLSRKNENDKRPREHDDGDDESDEPELVFSGKKPHITGIKRQARYDPGVPLSRDELTAWRKEARRVRNRESAAESRRRTRTRIEELEGKLSDLETKYAAALKRIVELEGCSSDSVIPTVVSQEAALTVKEPFVSPISSPVLTSVVSPISSPRSSFSLQESHQEIVEEKYQHIMTMITRPTAAKITGAGTTPSPPPPSVTSTDESSIEEIDEVEIGDFLMDALSDFTPTGDDVEHDAFLDQLCAV